MRFARLVLAIAAVTLLASCSLLVDDELDKQPGRSGAGGVLACSDYCPATGTFATHTYPGGPCECPMVGAGASGQHAGGVSGTAGGGSGTAGVDGGSPVDSGGAPTVAECTTDTVARSVPQACAECVCGKVTAPAAACAADADCWPLIQCVSTNCPADTTSCATTTCISYIGGLVTAQGVSTTLQGDCASVCISAPGTDGGTDDGGADAGN